MPAVTFLSEQGTDDPTGPDARHPADGPASANTQPTRHAPMRSRRTPAVSLDPSDLNDTNHTEGETTRAAAVSGTDTESSAQLLTDIDHIPYVSLPRILHRHLLTRLFLGLMSVAVLVCCALTVALPLCTLTDGTVTYRYTAQQSPSSWLEEIYAARHTDVQTPTPAPTPSHAQAVRSPKTLLTLIQVGAVGGLCGACVCFALAGLFLGYRCVMEQGRRRDNREASYTTHRLSEVVFTRRETTRRRIDGVIGWSLAVAGCAVFVFTVVTVVGLVMASDSTVNTWTDEESALVLSVTATTAAVVISLTVSVLLLGCLFVPRFSDFYPCGATVASVHFADRQLPNAEETAQSRAIRELVRQQREEAARQREEAARRANTVRGLTLEQSMPPSPWAFSLHSYAPHNGSHCLSAREVQEGSVVWCATSVHSHTGASGRPRTGHQRRSAHELSVLADPTAKFHPLRHGSRVSEGSVSKASLAPLNGAATNADDDDDDDNTWLVVADGTDDADASRQWSTVENPLLFPALRQYMKDTAEAAQKRGAPPAPADPIGEPDPLARVRALSVSAGRLRGLSTEAPLSPHSHAVSPTSAVMTSFSVGWRNAAVAPGVRGTGTRTSHMSFPNPFASGDHDEHAVETFTEYLCVPTAAPNRAEPNTGDTATTGATPSGFALPLSSSPPPSPDRLQRAAPAPSTTTQDESRDTSFQPAISTALSRTPAEGSTNPSTECVDLTATEAHTHRRGGRRPVTAGESTAPPANRTARSASCTPSPRPPSASTRDHTPTTT